MFTNSAVGISDWKLIFNLNFVFLVTSPVDHSHQDCLHLESTAAGSEWFCCLLQELYLEGFEYLNILKIVLLIEML